MGVSSFQILTLQLLPLPMKWSWVLFFCVFFPLSFFLFSPACLPHFLAGGQGPPCLTSGHLCCNYVQRTWLAQGRAVRSIFCPLVLLPQCSCTLTLFKGTCTGTGNVPHFLAHYPPALNYPLPSVLRLPLLCLIRTSTFHLVPF